MALIVLDLNGTVCHTKYGGAGGDFKVQRKAVTLRPFLDTFLEHIVANYDVAVWTCNGQSYANELVLKVFGRWAHSVRFVWNQSHCTVGDGREPWIKDLGKIDYDGAVFLVDDDADKCALQPAQHIPVDAFEGDKSDTALLALIGAVHRRAATC